MTSLSTELMQKNNVTSFILTVQEIPTCISRILGGMGKAEERKGKKRRGPVNRGKKKTTLVCGDKFTSRLTGTTTTFTCPVLLRITTSKVRLGEQVVNYFLSWCNIHSPEYQGKLHRLLSCCFSGAAASVEKIAERTAAFSLSSN